MPAELVRHGHQFDDADEIASLRDQVRGLREQLAEAKADASASRGDVLRVERSVTELRRQLLPLYRALQGVFGELDAIAPTDTSSVSAGSAKPAVWDAWKARLSPACGKIIDALQVHGTLEVQQLVVATGISRKQTIYDSIAAMKKAGIVDKNGGKFSLKQL